MHRPESLCWPKIRPCLPPAQRCITASLGQSRMGQLRPGRSQTSSGGPSPTLILRSSVSFRRDSSFGTRIPRDQRPTYSLSDSYLQFHYAIIEPHSSLLRDRDPRAAWDKRLRDPFDSRVRGPVFEEQARVWVRRYADESTLGGAIDVVGPSSVVIDGKDCQLTSSLLVMTAEWLHHNGGSMQSAKRRLARRWASATCSGGEGPGRNRNASGAGKAAALCAGLQRATGDCSPHKVRR